MKKFLLISSLLISFVGMTFSQDIGGIINPDTYSGFFVSVFSMIPLITFFTGLFYKWIPSIKGFWKQVSSWVVAIGLALGAKYLGLGIFTDLEILKTIGYGFLAGLGANGFYDIPKVKEFMELIKIKKTN